MSKKQTQKKTNKKVLLATLIPLGAVVAATAITLPLVLNKKPVEPGPTPEITDQQNVDEVNALLDGQDFTTMSQVVTYLSDKKDILNLASTDSQSQFVWDSDANKVIVINHDGEVTAKPSGYVLPEQKQKLWKMVSLPTQTNKLLSAKNVNGPYIEEVQENTTYSQYLRTSETYDATKPVKFISGIDAGENKNLSFNLIPSEDITSGDIVINANDNSSITISTKASDVQVYGNLLCLELDSLEADGNVTTNGNVLGNTIVKTQGSLTIAETSKVQQVIIDTKDSGAKPTIVVEANDCVAALTKTDGSADPEIESTDPSITKPTVDPTPVPTPSLDDLSGMGTPELPYILTCPEDFAKMQSQSRYSGSYHNYKLVCSRDEDGVMRIDASNWGSIGYGDLYGSFDGNNAVFEEINAPLFRTVSGPTGQESDMFTVKNVTLNCNIMRSDSTAGLIRNLAGNATIQNVEIGGYISGGTFACGVVGFGPGNITDPAVDTPIHWTFDKVHCDAIISSTSTTASGFIGHPVCNKLSESDLTFSDSYFDGTLANVGEYAVRNRRYTYFVGNYLPTGLKVKATYSQSCPVNPEGLYYETPTRTGDYFLISDNDEQVTDAHIHQAFICEEKRHQFSQSTLATQPVGQPISIAKKEGTQIAIASLIIGPDKGPGDKNYLSTYESDTIIDFPNGQIITNKARNYNILLNDPSGKEGIEGNNYYVKDSRYVSISNAYVLIAEYTQKTEGQDIVYVPNHVTVMPIISSAK